MNYSRGNSILDVAVSSTTSIYEPNAIPAANSDKGETLPVSNLADKDALFFELGLWLSGLESFLNIRNHSFIEENRAKAAARDWDSIEFIAGQFGSPCRGYRNINRVEPG